jgi:hypothetical protein
MSQINTNKKKDGIEGLAKGLFSDPMFKIASNNIHQVVNNLFNDTPRPNFRDGVKDKRVDENENAVQLNIFNDLGNSD